MAPINLSVGRHQREERTPILKDFVPAKMAGRSPSDGRTSVGTPFVVPGRLPLPLFALGSTGVGQETSKHGELGPIGRLGWRRSGVRDPARPGCGPLGCFPCRNMAIWCMNGRSTGTGGWTTGAWPACGREAFPARSPAPEERRALEPGPRCGAHDRPNWAALVGVVHLRI